MIITQVASLREKLHPAGGSSTGLLCSEGRHSIVLEYVKYAFVALFCRQELLQQTLGRVSFLYRPVGWVFFFLCYFVLF